MMIRKLIILLMVVLLAVPAGIASTMHDDDTTGMQRDIVRLHPERVRAKAVQKLREQMSQRAQEKDDPWDTSDEVWGTVDLPPVAVRDSAAVEGRRLTGGASDEQAPDQRMMWRDEPVTATIDQLSPYMVITDDGECRSKYVSTDSTSNEVYFAFALDDSLVYPLRLCVRFCTTSPVDVDQLTFTIDGFDYLFYPANGQCRPIAGGRYLAVSDDELRPGYRDLVYALTHGHWMMVKFQHGSASRVKVLTDGQREDFANTLAFYLLLGGGFPYDD